jgi:hypothetical protein
MSIEKEHRHESAAIKTSTVGNSGVLLVDYTGVFTDGAAVELVRKAREECERARVHIARIDRAVIACDTGAAVRSGFDGSLAPGCVVVRPDQREMMRAICAELGFAGAIRLVFLDYSEALRWANGLAAGLLEQELHQQPQRRRDFVEHDRRGVACRKALPANSQALINRSR